MKYQSGNLDFGAYQAMKNCVELKCGERVLIITDKPTESVGRALARQAELISPGNITTVIMESYGARPDDPTKALQLPEEIARTMRHSDVSFYAASGKPGELQSFREPLLQLVPKTGVRHAHMINVTEEVMRIGMAVDYAQVYDVTRRTHNAASRAESMRVTTPRGTDIAITFSPEYRWGLFDGKITQPGVWKNLPDGEVHTTPIDSEGILVVDGVLGDHFSHKYGLLDTRPVYIKVKNNHATEVRCTDRAIEDELIAYLGLGVAPSARGNGFGTDGNSDMIGEVAIGTCVGLSRLIGNILQDEKYPGNHCAFGDSIGEITGAPWKSNTHVDCVMRNCTIHLDDELIMENGVFAPKFLKD